MNCKVCSTVLIVSIETSFKYQIISNQNCHKKKSPQCMSKTVHSTLLVKGGFVLLSHTNVNKKSLIGHIIKVWSRIVLVEKNIIYN